MKESSDNFGASIHEHLVNCSCYYWINYF